MGHKQGKFGAASSELRELVKAVCEETLTPQQRDRLEELLRNDEEARMFYLAHLDMAARMQFMFRGGGNVSEEELVVRTGGSAGVRGLFRRFRGRAAVRVIALALSVLAFVGGAVLVYDRWVGTPPAAAGPPSSTPGWVAMLGRTIDVVWDGSAPDLSESLFKSGSQLRLKQGKVELAFACGAMMVVEGPAELEFESDLSVILRNGKVRAEVPEEANGFTVRTPRLNIVDRGTAFGASVSADGRNEVQVFQGKVDTEVRDPAGQPSSFFQLTEGEALNIGIADEAIVALSTNPNAFPRLPPLSPQQRWSLWESYRKRVLQDQDLVAYWSFDNRDGQDLSDNHNDGFPMNTPVYSADVPAALGGGLCLDLAGGPKFLQVSHSQSLEVSDSLTIAFWMRGGNQQQDWARIISKAGMMNSSGWVVHRVCDLNQIRAVVGNQRHRNQSLANVPSVYDDAWHHLAFVLNRGSWQVYLDGAFHAHGTYTHNEGLANNVDLIIGAAGEDQIMRGSLDFEGQIDELCLFRRPLAAEEIRRMCPVGELKLQDQVVQRPQAHQAVVSAKY
jgi:hypothetical protein